MKSLYNCPKCNEPLEIINHDGVIYYYCPKCKFRKRITEFCCILEEAKLA